MIRRFALGTLTALGLAGVAAAADLPTSKPAAPPPYAPQISWTGFYFGLNGGWIGSSGDNVSNTGADTGPGGLGAALAAGQIPRQIGIGQSGGVFGGQVGYNWQFSPTWVGGVETDLDWASPQGSASAVHTGGLGSAPFTTNFSRALEAVGTVRARIGFLATPTFLLYGTGGLAYGETKIGSSFVCPTCSPPTSTEATTANSNTGWSAGWTLGLGGEWKLAPNWSVKAEYLYVDLGSRSDTIAYTYPTANTSTLTSKADTRDNIVRVGVNYGF
ncbi:MAG: outer membrane beta-barrel protein [Roseiarcus sp.]|jgi:outer membrane immunogenic protein